MYGEDFSERFWSKVDIREPNDCWEWKAGGGLYRGGIWRGAFNYLTRDGKRGGSAHRAAYELVNGPIPEGLMVRHKCDNGACVNPAHLEVGTAMDNARDRDERNRGGCRPRLEKCKRGHHMNGLNIMKHGATRRCRECNRIKARAYLERQRIKLLIGVSV